jgi:hexokinase
MKNNGRRKANSGVTEEQFLSDLAGEFGLGHVATGGMIGNFHKEMERGLGGEECSLKMLPSFVGRPSGNETGDFLALDLGGTNLRVFCVSLEGRGKSSLKAAERFVIPSALMGGQGTALFDFIADCVETSVVRNKINADIFHWLAFTFSFPVDQLSILSGKLIKWTKGFTAAGVEGQDAALLLADALRRRGLGFLHVAALTNDATSTLAVGGYADPACDMGVILGTGTNACYPEKIARIRKRPDLTDRAGEMIVNIEWGNFDAGCGNRYDRMLDGASLNPGKQRFEKMVSGMYLGEIARLVIVEMVERGLMFRGMDPAFFSVGYALTSEHMAETAEKETFLRVFGMHDASDADKRCVNEVFRIVAERSARLAGAGIAAVVSWMDVDLERTHAIAIDGSLFLRYPGYPAAVRSLLQELYGKRANRISFLPVSDGSGIGAAVVAAVAVASHASPFPASG